MLQKLRMRWRQRAQASLTVSQLRTGLTTLPQELKDEIFSLVTACDDDTSTANDLMVRKMSPRAKPPVQLHISHQSRADFSKTYYSNSYFQFKDAKAMWSWLETAPAKLRPAKVNGLFTFRVESECSARYVDGDGWEGFSVFAGHGYGK